MNFFTYSSNSEFEVGDLVEVELRRKSYKAVVWRKVSKPNFKTKNIKKLLLKSALEPWSMGLVGYMSEYYFANIGTCLDLFLPKKIKDKNFDLETVKEIGELEINHQNLHNLSDSQHDVLNELLNRSGLIGLLHGITGSGKTEVYLHWIVKILEQDPTAQVLVLVPEISLTPQIVEYVGKVFPKEFITLYNSKLNKTEQQEEWKRIFYGQSRIVIGSRSSLFMPFKNLKAVIVDEEHDSSYKQDMDPKYHVRQLVQYLSAKLDVSVLFGSATPSVEVYKAAMDGKIDYFQLSDRVKASEGLEYEVVDMKDERKRGNWHYMSDKLVESITAALSRNEQVMLLHNRRGSSNYLQCVDCGQVEECVNCSISLTPHGQELLCHYCNHKKPVPFACSFCGSVEIKNVGIGVKGLELELKDYFPKAKIVRIDSDTNSRKNAHIENYKSLKDGEADIVVGTQTIATGLDVENVSLVGVINVDQHLNFPDFRASERAYQLLTQFSGRAGRGKVKGKVVLQTFQDDSVVIRSIVDEDFEGYVSSEMEVRRMFMYPPFSKMTRLIYSNKDKLKVMREVEKVVSVLDAVKYPRYKSSAPLIERKHGKFYHQVILFDLNPKKIIDYLDLGKGWSVDRDPMNMI